MGNLRRLGLVILTLAAVTIAISNSAFADLAVAIFYVEIGGQTIDPKFYACGNSSIAGPFMSSATAIEFRNEFAAGAEVEPHMSNEDGICSTNPWFHDNGNWHQ
jgi:hypothetical protein